MRVLQLIDSLRLGGAEQMAVSYANALAKRIDASYLCCTRMEGLLKKRILPAVNYLFLEKKSTVDLNAFWKLRKFVEENKIDILQAHSSSWFLALQVKMALPHVKLVWHDHYGKELDKRNPGFLILASKYFNGIISVNAKLEQWAKERLKCKQVRYFRNFLPEIQEYTGQRKLVVLQGPEKAFKIICVANLRPQKDHLTLLRAFSQILKKEKDISLHLVGKDNEDFYSRMIKAFIKENNLDEKVFLYGEQEEIISLLKQADLGVLSSVSEGLPVALLEYGCAGLPVISTDVGECQKVIEGYGKVVPSGEAVALANAMSYYKNRVSERKEEAAAFHKKINSSFAETNIISQVIGFLQHTLTPSVKVP